MTTALDDTPSPRPRFHPDQFTVLLLTLWLAVVVPRISGSILSPKYRTSVGDGALHRSPIADYSQRLLNITLIVVCLWIIGGRLRNLPTDRRLPLVMLIAPWVYQASRDLYADHSPKFPLGYLYPLVVVAVWVLRPRLERLSLLGWLIGITVIANLALAVVFPAKGLFSSSGGDLIAPEKQILPLGILVGMFSNGNVLGQFVVLGLPAIALIRKNRHRAWILGLSGFTLLWTSSRSSLASFVIMIAVLVLLGLLRASAQGLVSAMVLLATSAAVVVLPLTAKTNEAYTNRGYIWRTSLRNWAVEPWTGLGSNWYNHIGKFVNALPDTAFNGHNLFVHTLVTGGIVYVVLLLLMFLCLFYYAMAWAIRGMAYPTAFLASFFVSTSLEVAFGVVDHQYLFVVNLVPFAVVCFSSLPPNPIIQANQQATALMDLRGLRVTTTA